MVRYFFQEGVLPDNINDTIITLVPKVEALLNLKDFRPISLYNVLYKIISKILTAWIKVILLRFISKYQCAFLPGDLQLTISFWPRKDGSKTLKNKKKEEEEEK